MAAPFDFWLGKIKINYNRDLAEPSSYIQDENGWSEDYPFPISLSAAQMRVNFRNLIAARCALLSAGMYVFDAKFSQASVYKDSYDLAGNATLPVPDYDEFTTGVVTACDDVDVGPQYRFEDGAGRRWSRIIRGVRALSINDMFYSPGNYSIDPVSGAAAPQPAANLNGVAASVTSAVTAGAVSGFTVVSGGSGYTYTPPVLIGGPGSGATATATVVSGVVTAITLGVGGTGYSTAPVITIPPPQYEPWALVPFQGISTYTNNFMAAVAKYCINFHPVRVANSAFPSGFMTQGDTNPAGGGSPYTAARVLLQKLANRQSGRINIHSKARRKAYV